MNKWEKEVMNSLLDSEEEALEQLEKQYSSALSQIKDRIKLFQSDIDMLDSALETADDAQKEIFLSMKRSKVYQKQFQEALEGQINGIIEQLHSKNYATIERYLKETYQDSYLGTMYDLSNQGVQIITPIDQNQVVKAVLTDSKVSQGFYARLGVDANRLKKDIMQEVSRGIASSLSFSQIAMNIDNASKVGLSNANRIVRTEGNRIQNQASRDMAENAVAHGADIVKIWDATLDGKTRESHRMVDGEVRELDEPFSNGLDKPSDPAGAAEEVINCRCKEIHKPRWALDDSFVKMDNFTGELREFNSPQDYKEFKEWYWSKENQQYMEYVQGLENKYNTKDMTTLLTDMSEREYQKFHELESASPMWKTVAPSVKDDIMYLPDIVLPKSVGAKAKDTQVKMPDRTYAPLTENTRITHVQVIAGKGRNRQIDQINDLLHIYKDSNEFEWQKCKGIGYVDYEGETYKVELHWYQEPSVGRVDFKVKPDADGNWFLEDDDY